MEAAPPGPGMQAVPGAAFRSYLDGLVAEYSKLLGENELLRAEINRTDEQRRGITPKDGAYPQANVQCTPAPISVSPPPHPFGVFNALPGSVQQTPPPMPEGQPPFSGFHRPESMSSYYTSLASEPMHTRMSRPPSPSAPRDGKYLWAKVREYLANGRLTRAAQARRNSKARMSVHSEDIELSAVWKKSAKNLHPHRHRRQGSNVSVVDSGTASAATVTKSGTLKRAAKHVWSNEEERGKKKGCGVLMRKLIMKPDDKRHLAWDLLSLLILSYDILGTPLEVFEPPQTKFTKAMEYVTLVFWTMDLFLTFFSGYHTVKSIEMRPSRIAWHYFRTWFIFDFSIITLEWLSVGEASILRIGKFARGFRVIRLLRILKVQILFEQLNDFIRSETSMMVFQIGRLVAFILVINHFVACGWWAVGTLVEEVSIHWTDRVRAADDRMGYAYLTSLHWALTQFTPASMEVVPTNVWERAYTIFVLMMGLGAFSSFLASISSLMTQLRQLKAQQHKEDVLIRRYLMEHSVSLELGNHILFFFRENRRFTKRKRLVEQDVKAFEQLPDSLRIKLHWEVYEPVITPHPLFFTLNESDPSGLVEVCHRSMSESILGAGHELFHFGKIAERMYFVGKGDLEFVPGQDDKEPFEVGSNAWLSEMVLWMNWIHRGTVTAKSNAELVELDAKKFHEHVRHRTTCFEICRGYAKLYVQRLANCCPDDEELPPDTWGHVDDLQQIVHETNEGLQRQTRKSLGGVLNLLLGVFTEKDNERSQERRQTSRLSRTLSTSMSFVTTGTANSLSTT